MRSELKRFFIRNYPVVGIFFGVYVIAYFSLLRAGISYTDDVVREITGQSYFLIAGRPVTDFAVRLVFGGEPLLDISPLFQLAALLFLSLASLAFVYGYKRERRLWVVLAALAIGLNPFVVENLGYKFDSVFMCVALLLAMFPLYAFKGRSEYIWWGGVFVFLSLSTYQAAIGAFLIIIFHRLIGRACGGVGFRESSKQFFIEISPLAIGALAYKLIVAGLMSEYLSGSSWSRSHSQLAPVHEFFEIFLRNVINYASQYYVDWSRTLVGKLAAGIIVYFLVLSVFAFVKGLQRSGDGFSSGFPRRFASNLARTGLLAFGLVGFFLSPGGLQYFLNSPVFTPRTLYTSGVLFAFILADVIVLTNSMLLRRVVVVVQCYLIILFATISALFGNLLAQQAAWENLKYPLLVNDIATIINADPAKRIQFYGHIGYAPRVNVAIGKLPYLTKVVRYYIGNIWSFPATLSTLGLSRTNVVHAGDSLAPGDVEAMDKVTLFSRDGYRIFDTDEGYILVVFESL